MRAPRCWTRCATGCSWQCGACTALLEQADWDERFGRVMNANLAEYLVPVNADVVELEALFVDCDDPREALL